MNKVEVSRERYLKYIENLTDREKNHIILMLSFALRGYFDREGKEWYSNHKEADAGDLTYVQWMIDQMIREAQGAPS